MASGSEEPVLRLGEDVTISNTSTGEEVTMKVEDLLALGVQMPTREEADELIAHFEKIMEGLGK